MHTTRASSFLGLLAFTFVPHWPTLPTATEYEARMVLPRVEGSMFYSDSDSYSVVSLK